TSTRIKLGKVLLRDRKYEEAVSQFQEILKRDPANREVRFTLGLIYYEWNKHDEAIAEFSEVLKGFPNDDEARYFRAAAYGEKKLYGEALADLNKIPVSSDLYANAQIQIGVILKKQNRPQEAIEVTKKAMNVKKGDPALYGFLASLYEDAKDLKTAEQTLLEGLTMAPANADLHYRLGVLYEKTDRFNESMKQMEEVLKIEPESAEALNFIGYSYADRGIKLQEAEDMIKKALELRPGDGYITDSLGWVYFKQNRTDEAVKYLEEALRILPEDPAIAEHLGDAYARTGRVQDAIEKYKLVLQLKPDAEKVRDKMDTLSR
ncbi:MAG: tetratricopeptide repeat protein, partial [Deltaproteobacteria bacterium]|nr:tetratricopeptide repeat protein [Deltaproteobacteria bacterium]